MMQEYEFTSTDTFSQTAGTDIFYVSDKIRNLHPHGTVGLAAGIFTIAVNTGPLSEEELYNAGADIVYPNIEAFANDIKKIL